VKRKEIDLIKAEVARLLQRIDEMERLAGWTRYSSTKNSAGNYDHATSKPHPEDRFNGGQYTAAVKRASLDLSKALVEIRR
jgi:hypothetical protein